MPLSIVIALLINRLAARWAISVLYFKQ